MEKTNADATVDGGEYRGLTGGTAMLGAYCDFSKLDNPDTPFVPEIQVTAFDVPIDRFFLNAIPRQEGVAHIGDRLAALNPTGTAGVQAWLGLNQQGESVYEVRIRPANAAITPPASGERAVALRDIKGEITAVDEGVTVGLTGTAFDPLPHAADDAASPIRLDARIEYAAGAERVAPDGSPTLDPRPSLRHVCSFAPTRDRGAPNGPWKTWCGISLRRPRRSSKLSGLSTNRPAARMCAPSSKRLPQASP